MIRLEVWLYGPLATYGGDAARPGHAELHPEMPEGTTVGTLVDHLRIPTEEKGMVFVNGELADMPGLNASSTYPLKNGDRVGLFHRVSMWPFQYRHGAAISPALEKAMEESAGGMLHHSPASVQRSQGGEGDSVGL